MFCPLLNLDRPKLHTIGLSECNRVKGDSFCDFFLWVLQRGLLLKERAVLRRETKTVELLPLIMYPFILMFNTEL